MFKTPETIQYLCKAVQTLKTLGVLADERVSSLTAEEKGTVLKLASSLSNLLDRNPGAEQAQWDNLNAQLRAVLEGEDNTRIMKTAAIWLENYKRKTGLLLLQQIIDAASGQEKIDPGTTKQLLAFFEDAPIDAENKAMALYLLSGNLAEEDPALAYANTVLAYRLDPELGLKLGEAYVYREAELKETYTEICPICGSDAYTPFFCADMLRLVTDNSRVAPVKLWLKCDHCHNLYAFNFPISEMENMNGHYTAQSPGFVLTPRQPLHIYGDIFNKCFQYTEGRKYLEIGLGNGEMAATALEMGFDVEAVEICLEDAQNTSSALGIPVTNGDFLDFKSDHQYDVIIMGDVLEHMAKPADAIKKASALLAPGGVLWISTPNYNSGFTRMKKFTDAMWFQQNHFTYFSYETLVPLLKAEGLCVVHYDVSTRYNGSMELFCRQKE